MVGDLVQTSVRKHAQLDPAYPRPQFYRRDWQSLDGTWDFAFCTARAEAGVAWSHSIEVPFPPEAELSGLGDLGFHRVVWYRRSFEVPPEWRGKQVVLHFGAVDYAARVWVNGRFVAAHKGGHTPFSADITDVLNDDRQTITVRAEDDPHELDKPRGKQDWQLKPHSIWYPRTTGIWQPVWIEPVPQTRLAKVRFTPDLATFSLAAEVQLEGDPAGLSLAATFSRGGEVLAADTWQCSGRTLKRRVDLPDPGIDDARKHFLWSPEHPNLIDVSLTLKRGQDVIDEVTSYTALRSVSATNGKFNLNGRPYFLRLALDQGYWHESLLAAPNPAALKRDVRLAKALGFNGVRKHQKIEDPRYLYWADKLGLLVWAELPSAYSFTPEAVQRLSQEWLEVLERDYNHPCVVAWVAFNESWGVPDLPTSPQQRHLVQGLYHLAKALDATRPVVGNDGWEHVVSDLLTLHDYTSDLAALRRRYASDEAVRDTLDTFRPGGRSVLTETMQVRDQPALLTEFGGVRYSTKAEGWGYDEVDSPEALLKQYRGLIKAASGQGLAGFCYTQLTDTFQEQNGLLYMNRRPKADLRKLARATKSPKRRRKLGGNLQPPEKEVGQTREDG